MSMESLQMLCFYLYCRYDRQDKKHSINYNTYLEAFSIIKSYRIDDIKRKYNGIMPIDDLYYFCDRRAFLMHKKFLTEEEYYELEDINVFLLDIIRIDLNTLWEAFITI